MTTIALMKTRIEEIDVILSTGVSTFMSGEDRVTYDLVALAKERDRLMRIIASYKSSQFRRVVFKDA